MKNKNNLIKFNVDRNFTVTERYLEKLQNLFKSGMLDKYGRMGVESLLEWTPKDTGKTSRSWKYKITNENGMLTLSWYNTNVVDGTHVAVVLQYGRMSKRGYWIEGRDYINPAMQPVFDEIAKDLWGEVTRVDR